MDTTNYLQTLFYAAPGSGYFILACCSNPEQLWTFPSFSEGDTPATLEIDFDDGSSVPLTPGPGLIKGAGSNVTLRWDWSNAPSGACKVGFNPFNITGIQDNYPMKAILNVDSTQEQYFQIGESNQSTIWGLDVSISSDVGDTTVNLYLDGGSPKSLPYGASSLTDLEASSIAIGVTCQDVVTVQFNLRDLKAGR